MDKIKSGDRVFLYHDGVGYIATGHAKQGFKIRGNEYDQYRHEMEHYIPLILNLKANPYSEENKCVSAKEIKRATNKNLEFRGTCARINKQLANKIQAMMMKKHRKLS